jgi:hypothetical protein
VSILPFSFKPPAPPTPPTPPPPASSSCTTTMQLAQPGAPPQQSASQMLRSSAGQTRVDTGDTSIITDPKAAKTIILNHATKEATEIPIPPAPTAPGAPSLSAPGMPGGVAPPTSPSQVVDLGKSVINGHAVTGKQFTFPTPSAPTPPGAPAMPGAPALPGAPTLPGAAQAPGAPALPGMPTAPPHTVMEVWSSASLLLPVLTKVTGPFGQQVSQCQVAQAPEPPPTKFQIPSNYKLAKPPVPPAPTFPK